MRFVGCGFTSWPTPATFRISLCESCECRTSALSDHLERMAFQSFDLVNRPVVTDHSSRPCSVEPREWGLIIEWQT